MSELFFKYYINCEYEFVLLNHSVQNINTNLEPVKR